MTEIKSTAVARQSNARPALREGLRAVVIVMRERGGRLLPFVVKHEAEAVPIVIRRIVPVSTVHVDEARSWDPLYYGGYDIVRVKHEEVYSDGTACTKNAESYFSRLRRAELGQQRHIARAYLNAYAHEAAWREDKRPRSSQTRRSKSCIS